MTTVGKRQNMIGMVVVLLGFVLSALSCGEEAPQLEGGDPEQIAKSIQKAEHHRDWESWHQFCRARWDTARIGRPKEVRLVLNSTKITRETRTFGRILNGDINSITYGVEPIVDRLVDDHWYPQRFVQDGTGVGFNLALRELRPNRASGCIEIPISETWRPGMYRVRFSLESGNDRGSGDTIRPGAYFRVTSLPSQR